MKKIYPYKRKVYYYETDKMSIMHHSNYIRILEETRVSMLNQAGTPFEQIEALGILMPVLSVDCQYRSPLRFDDEFTVYPKIVKFNGTIMELEYRVVNSTHCFTDTSLKPIRTRTQYPEIYRIFNEYNGYDITD